MKGEKYKEIARILNLVPRLKLRLTISSLIKISSNLLDYLSLFLIIKAIGLSLIETRILKEAFALAFIVALLGILVKAFDTFYSHDLSYRIIEDVRDHIFQYYYSISPGAVEDIKSGDFIQMIVNDINVIEWFIAHILLEWLTILSLAVLAIIITFKISFALMISVLLSCILAIIIFLRTRSSKEEEGFVVKEAGGKLYSKFIDGVEGSKELVSFGVEDDFYEEIKKTSKEYNQISNRYIIEEEKTNLKISLIFIIASLIIFKVNKLESINYILSISLLIKFISQFLSTIKGTGNYGFIFGAVKRLGNLYDIKATVSWEGDNKLDPSNIDKGIEFVKCKFYYPKAPSKMILNNLTFKINKGEKTVIVSESGGGKTTIVKLINRFYDPTGGIIKIFGENIKNCREESIRENITSLSQDIFLFNDTLFENLKYAKPDLKLDQARAMAKKVNALDFIEAKKDGFDTLVSEAGGNFSGGEIQRIGIMRALLKDSPILILDESSSALDRKNEALIDQVMDEIKADKIVIIVAHRIKTIEKADKIIFLDQGKLDDLGRYDELIERNQKFRDLINLKREDEASDEN